MTSSSKKKTVLSWLLESIQPEPVSFIKKRKRTEIVQIR